MTAVSPLDRPGTRRAMFMSEATVAAVVVFLAVRFGTGWSWGLFIWGAAFGSIAVLWARWSSLIVMNRIVSVGGIDRALYERRKVEMWHRYRWTYISIMVFGFEAGVLSAALEHPGPDIAFMVLWFVAGVLPTFIAYPFLLRKARRDAAALPTDVPEQSSHDDPG